jgi:type I restriction enzyme M protein
VKPLNTKEVIDRIFKGPGTQYELTEFDDLGKPLHEILDIYPRVSAGGRDTGKIRYFLKSFIPFSSGNDEVQVFAEDGKSNPEEIVRQLWVYKLMHCYGYQADEMDLEASVQFGTEASVKAADIVVYTNRAKDTPKLIVECKKPKRKDGIEQLKRFMNAKGAPVAVWSNGSDRIILYRPYPKAFDDTLFDMPKRGQEPRDVLTARKAIGQLKQDFNFKKIIQDLEELVLAESGKDEFNEIFKLIFAKIWDEKAALERRKDQTVEFGKALDPEITYGRINGLFKSACAEWPGIFKADEGIELAKWHLQVCVGPIEGLRLMGSNLRIMDDAFEYLIPTEAKKKKGQFFTPRHVVEMCVRMLNPTRTEYVLDPSCGSGGFLLHAMDWCYPARDNAAREQRQHRYAARYLWGVDFEARAAKTSRALLLIAGDGHTNIFGPDVSSLDPRTWFGNASGHALMHGLRQAKLTAKKIPENEVFKDEDKAWEYFDELKFDVILANPPFAGEIKDRKILARYDLARPALKRAGDDKAPKEERDVLFIERIVKMLRPGGRAAIVLPQGKFNNSSLAFLREWILKKARILAVVGLHPNTFKPHTGTKTSVLFVQKYTEQQLADIARVHDEVAKDCPAYESMIRALLDGQAGDIAAEAIPEAVAELIAENFSESSTEESEDESAGEEDTAEPLGSEERIALAEEKLARLQAELGQVQHKLAGIDSAVQALEQQQQLELEAIGRTFDGARRELSVHLKPFKEQHKEAIRELKGHQKEKSKPHKADIKRLEKEIPAALRELKLLSNRGKLELILADPDLLATLAERWIAAEVAKRLDYPIFMAVSERSGKNNAGDYEYMLDEDGHVVLDASGQPRIDQDLVDFDVSAEALAAATTPRPGQQVCVAEAFVHFAKQQGFAFWGDQ